MHASCKFCFLSQNKKVTQREYDQMKTSWIIFSLTHRSDFSEMKSFSVQHDCWILCMKHAKIIDWQIELLKLPILKLNLQVSVSSDFTCGVTKELVKLFSFIFRQHDEQNSVQCDMWWILNRLNLNLHLTEEY